MSRPKIDPSTRRSKRVQVGFTGEEKAWLKARAKEAGLEVSVYVHALVMAERGKDAPPRPRKFRVADEVLDAVNRTYLQLRKIGGNINQLAHQANAGMVAVTRSEAVYLINAVQTAVSDVKGTMEKLTA